MKKSYLKRFGEFLCTQKYVFLFRDQYPYCIDYIEKVLMVYTPLHSNQIKFLEKLLETLSVFYAIPQQNIWTAYHEYNYGNNVGKIHKYAPKEFLQHCRNFEDHIKSTMGEIWPSK